MHESHLAPIRKRRMEREHPLILPLPPGSAICEAVGRQATAAQSDIRKLAVAEASQGGKSSVDVARMSGQVATCPVVPHDMSNAFDHPYCPQGQR